MTAVAAVASFVATWLAIGQQHRLYIDNPPPDEGPVADIRRIGLSVLAAVAAGIAARPDHYEPGPAALTCVVIVVLAVLSSTDFERKLLPNRLTYPAILFAMAFAWAWPDRSTTDVLLGGGVALAIGIALYVLGALLGAVLAANVIPFGMGDVKLIIFIGFVVGVPAVFAALAYGVISGGIQSVAMIVAGRGRGVFSYGPHLALGALIPLLWPSNFM